MELSETSGFALPDIAVEATLILGAGDDFEFGDPAADDTARCKQTNDHKEWSG